MSGTRRARTREELLRGLFEIVSIG